MERFLTLRFKGEGKASEVHNEVIRDLLHFIRGHYTDSINYDHVFSTVLREPISLKYRGKRYDIAFMHKGRRVLIQVEAVKTRTRSKKDGGENGQGQG